MNILKIKQDSKTKAADWPAPKKHHWVILFCLIVLLAAGTFFVAKTYSSELNTAVIVQNIDKVKKGQEIVIQFEKPMLKASLDSGINFEPNLAFTKYWEGENRLVLKIEQDLLPETEYKGIISGAKTKWLVPLPLEEFSFRGPETPVLVNIYPQDKQAEVDFVQSIKLELDRPIGDEFKLEVKIDPPGNFSYVIDETAKQVTVVPESQLAEDAEYKVGVLLHHRFFADYSKELYSGTFHTKKKPLEVTYNLGEDGQPLKTEIRKEQVEPQLKEGRYIDIDLSSQVLFLFENGIEKGAYKISSGKRGMNTPEGKFKVLLKAKRPWSKKYNLYMPWFIGFTNLGHGLHELPEWPGGYKEGANHLGTPVSHGCVRLGVGPAKIVYDFAEKDMPIIIHQ